MPGYSGGGGGASAPSGIAGDVLSLDASGDFSAARLPLALCKGQLVDTQGVCVALILDVAGIATADETLSLKSSAGTETWTAKASRGGANEYTIGTTAATAAANMVTAINTDSSYYAAAVVAGLGLYGATGTAVVVWCLLAATTTLRSYGDASNCSVISFDGGNYTPANATRATLPAADPGTEKGGIAVAAASVDQDWQTACDGLWLRYGEADAGEWDYRPGQTLTYVYQAGDGTGNESVSGTSLREFSLQASILTKSKNSRVRVHMVGRVSAQVSANSQYRGVKIGCQHNTTAGEGAVGNGSDVIDPTTAQVGGYIASSTTGLYWEYRPPTGLVHSPGSIGTHTYTMVGCPIQPTIESALYYNTTAAMSWMSLTEEI